MQIATGGCEPAQQNASGSVHFRNIAQNDVDSLPQGYRLIAARRGDRNVITGELSIDGDQCAGPAVDSVDSENS
jgi:hypothetical protein